MSTSIVIKNISKDFPVGRRFTRVLYNISQEVQNGQLTMLVGPSGCGKTTLISIISGILASTEGDIELYGNSLNAMSDNEKVLFRRQNIGFIFQQYHLLPALTTAENAAMPLLAAGVKEREAIHKAEEMLERIGLNSHSTKLPRQLSGGQQQRVAIARALVHNPRLIICDEPTAALDAKTGQSVMQILRDIASTDERTVLLVTHDNRIYHFADRILEMADGKLIGDYSAKAFMEKEHL